MVLARLGDHRARRRKVGASTATAAAELKALRICIGLIVEVDWHALRCSAEDATVRRLCRRACRRDEWLLLDICRVVEWVCLSNTAAKLVRLRIICEAAIGVAEACLRQQGLVVVTVSSKSVTFVALRVKLEFHRCSTRECATAVPATEALEGGSWWVDRVSEVRCLLEDALLRVARIAVGIESESDGLLVIEAQRVRHAVGRFRFLTIQNSSLHVGRLSEQESEVVLATFTFIERALVALLVLVDRLLISRCLLLRRAADVP